MKKLILILWFCFQSMPAQLIDVTNPAHLLDITKVKNHLKDIGFEEVEVSTPDKKLLEGMFLCKKDAEYSVLIQGGWMPGHFKGMAAFQKMLEEENCNILFLNGRGRGNSSPLSIKDELLYGTKQPKDILGGLQYLHNNTDKKPIVTLNICASAFNAPHAVLALQKEKAKDKPQVIGMVFDSGWTSVNKITQSVAAGKYGDWLVKHIAKMKNIKIRVRNHGDPNERELVYKNREKIRKSFLFRLFFIPVFFVYRVVHTILGKIWYIPLYEKKTTLEGKMKNLKTNIMFVHSEHDNDVPIEEVKKIAQEVSEKFRNEYYVKNAKHASIQFIYFDEYKSKLLPFIQKSLSQYKNPMQNT